ncbi:MAG: hypothetical protein RLZZ144_577 [Pseudomonadota bacterium]|jgi:thioredoxin-like negative regulator of GroEL
MLFDRRIKLIFSLVLAMLVLPSAYAVNIGEVQVQSRWGEPLRAQVELRVNAGELIEESCLSLTVPDVQGDDLLVYLTRAVLGIKREAGRQIVTINTSQPFKEMFAKIQLQVKCANSGGMNKVLTILPDLGAAESVAVNEINVPITQLENGHAETVPPATDNSISPTLVPAKAAVANFHKKKASTPNKPKTVAKSTLQVSSAKLDLAKLAKAGGDKNALQAKLKELNTDDQIAAMLAMQNEMQLLRNELNEMKAKLQSLPARPAIAASVVPIAAPPVVAVSSFEFGTSFWLSSLSGLLLLGLLGWRYFERKKNDAMAAQEAVDGYANWQQAPAVVATSPVPASVALESAPSEVTQKISAYAPNHVEASEADLLMEEAQLYAAHNRPQKAIEMLSELIEAYPEKMEVWLALLTNYAVLRDVASFAKLAHRLQLATPDEHTWALVQSLGRTLDPNNSLFQEVSLNMSRVATNEAPVIASDEPVLPAAIANAELTSIDVNAEAAKVEAALPASAPVVVNTDRFKPLEFDLDFKQSSKPEK